MKTVDMRPAKGLEHGSLIATRFSEGCSSQSLTPCPPDEFVTKLGIYLFLLREETSR